MLTATYVAWTDQQRARLAESLLAEINGLLTLTLEPMGDPPPAYDDLLDGLAARLGRAIEGPDCHHAASDTHAMIAALTHAPKEPLRALFSDLAEIIALPRRQRSEYTSNRDAAPPYRVRKLLLEYAVYSRKLDELVGALSKPFCAHRCDKPPVGCCHILGYDLGLVPEVMLELQELEARRNGWQPPEHEEHCRYHSATGCVIALFKSPACVGYLCEPLTADLRARFSGPPLDVFLKALSVFNNCDLDRQKVFRAMRATIAAGRGLLSA